MGLSVRGLGGEHTPIGADGTVDISPSARFCISEAEIVTALYKGIELLKSFEGKGGITYKLLYAASEIAGAVAKIKEIKTSNPGNIMA